MRLRFRLLWLIVETVFKKRRSLADENVLNMRVLPNDVDVTRVSNDRYLTFMDLGRISIVLQAGLLRTLVRQRWGPLRASSASGSGIRSPFFSDFNSERAPFTGTTNG